MFPVYFLTWTTYGTWLPGDGREWVDTSDTSTATPIKPPDPRREQHARLRMRAQPVVLSERQRDLVEKTIHEVVQHRGWHLAGVNVRTNHVHVVICCPNVTPERVMSQLKAWAARRLNEDPQGAGLQLPPKWWTRHGSTRYLNTEEAVDAAVRYVVEGQDRCAR